MLFFWQTITTTTKLTDEYNNLQMNKDKQTFITLCYNTRLDTLEWTWTL